jgi:hypothetical protein
LIALEEKKRDDKRKVMDAKEAEKLAKEEEKRKKADEKEQHKREKEQAKLAKVDEKARLAEETRLAKEAKKASAPPSKKKNALRRDASDLTYYSSEEDENDENDANAANLIAQGEKRARATIDYSRFDSRGLKKTKVIGI